MGVVRLLKAYREHVTPAAWTLHQEPLRTLRGSQQRDLAWVQTQGQLRVRDEAAHGGVAWSA
jgi:hypothetical protein